MFCQYCGAEKIIEDAQFCSNCGKRYSFVKNDNLNVNVETAAKPATIKLGFGWGNFLIFISFLQGGLAFFLGFVGGLTTEVLPNRGVSLVVSVYLLGLALGLLKRKKLALYLLYITVVLWIISGLYIIMQGTIESILVGIFVIGLWILWFRYFQRRKDLVPIREEKGEVVFKTACDGRLTQLKIISIIGFNLL